MGNWRTLMVDCSLSDLTELNGEKSSLWDIKKSWCVLKTFCVKKTFPFQ